MSCLTTALWRALAQCAGCEFSHDGRFLAVVERREYKDLVGIYATDTWELVKHFQVDTVDLEDLAWSPDDRFIAIWDTPLEVRAATGVSLCI